MKQKRAPLAALFSIIMAFSNLVSAQELMDTFNVTDYWYRPGGISWAFGSSGGGTGGTGGNTEEAIVANELARQQRCSAVRAAYAALKCAGKSTTPPDFAGVGIPNTANGIPAFSTSPIWGTYVVGYANVLFTTTTTTDDARRAAAAAIRDSLNACNGTISCQNDVLQYFGINRVTIPIIGSIGDINNAYNRFLELIGLGTDFAQSEAGKVADKFYGLQVCQGIAAQGMNAQNRCGAL
jgi:hypothetical protein